MIDIIQTIVLLGLCVWCAMLHMTISANINTLKTINGILRRMVG